MTYIKILNNHEKKEIVSKLNQQFGVKELKGNLIKIGAERLFIFQGSLNERELKRLEKIVPIERIGVYFGKIQNDMIRLSIEGVHILANQINKNIFEIDETQIEQWMMGQDLQIETGVKDFLIIRHKEDFVGCGKASEGKIGNYIPKARRLKYKEK